MEDRSEAAFAELVARHLDWVHSSALRQVADHSLAEEAAQSAFLILARQSGEVLAKVARGAPLSAWLHVTVRNVAVKMTRGEVRRRAREKEAGLMNHDLQDDPGRDWDAWSPHLDQVLSELVEADRHALLMRFFERRTAREIGNYFGVSEEAAQKRISRAVERLRALFARRGIAVSDSGLVAALAVSAVGTAPSGLAATIGCAVAASLPAASQVGGVLGLTKSILIMSNSQMSVLGVVMIPRNVPLRYNHSRELNPPSHRSHRPRVRAVNC